MLQVAQAMFVRNAGDYAEPALLDLAWVDADIRAYWQEQAEAVRADLEQLAVEGCVTVHPRV